MEMYKKAIFTGLSFPTNKGILVISQLPSLSLNDLTVSLKALKAQLKKEEEGELDFLDDSKKVNTTLELQFEILKDVYLTKKANQESLTKAAETKAHNQKILALIAEKKDSSLKEMSVKELEALLK